MNPSLLDHKPAQDQAANSPLTDSVQKERERILNAMTIGAAIVGVLDFFLVVVRSLDETPWWAFAVYMAVAAWIVPIAVFRRMSYRVRAVSMVAILYALGLTSYLQTGLTGDGAVFMLGFVFMVGILIGKRGSIFSVWLGLATIVTIALLFSQHVIAPSQDFEPDNLSAWINRILVWLLLGVAIVISLSTMLRGLYESLNKAIQFGKKLEQDRVDIQERSAELEKRSTQIRTAAEISRSISGVLNPQTLLQEVVDLIQERFHLYYAGVFLVDEQQRFAVLRAGTGAPGQEMIRAGHKLLIGESSMIGWTIHNRKARIALDVGQDAVRFANPHLPETRSELALPLVAGERVLGALSIQSELPAAFDQDDITVLQNISDTLAISLDNARLFFDLETNLDEIRRLHSQYLKGAWSGRLAGNEQSEFSLSADLSTREEMTAIEIPMTLREQTIGQIALESSSEWSSEERALIESVASQAAYALENARLLEESQQMALRERLVAEITSKIWSSANTDAILQTAIRELGRALRADEASIELRLD